MSGKPSRAEIVEYIDERIRTDWGWDQNYEKQPGGYTLRDIANKCMQRFGANNVPRHPQSYKRFVEQLRARLAIPDEEEQTEAARLLLPENFPEFRRLLRGEHYETPPHQLHLFNVLYALTYKLPIPQATLDYFDEMDPANPFPEDINELIVQQKVMLSFMFLMAPRHGKTDLLQDFVIHTHCNDPNRKILFGNGTIKKTEGFIGNYFMSVLEQHDDLNRLYGPFRHDERAWSKTGYVLAKREGFHKSMSMQPFGISGSVLSLDSDLILADDISDLRRALSETTTDDDVDWLTTQLMTRREPNTAFVYVGSHVVTQTGDLFERIIEKREELSIGDHRLIFKKVPAHRYDKCNPTEDPEHTKCVIWPSLRPYSFLEAMRGLMGDDDQFEAVYQQIPRQKKQLHFPGNLMRAPYVNMEYSAEDGVTPPPPREPAPGVLDEKRSWREEAVCCGLRTFETMGFDPAASERKGASFSAAVVLGGCVKCGRRYLIDYWKDRQSPEMHPVTIGSITAEYPAIAVLNIEINAYQRALSRDPRMQDIEARSGFYIKEWNTDERKHDPIQGIPSSARHVKAGMLSVPSRTIFDQEFAEPLLKEFIRWPQTPNDLVMAFWLADLAMTELIEDSRHVVAELMPGSEKYRSQWHDEITYEVDLSIPFDEPADYV